MRPAVFPTSPRKPPEDERRVLAPEAEGVHTDTPWSGCTVNPGTSLGVDIEGGHLEFEVRMRFGAV